jgi:biopolymer transport protein ExbB/TolQ
VYDKPGPNFRIVSGYAKAAMLAGLLVTVFSMIRTFAAIQQHPGEHVPVDARMIGLALVPIVCAIPMAFAHVCFKNRRR